MTDLFDGAGAEELLLRATAVEEMHPQSHVDRHRLERTHQTRK